MIQDHFGEQYDVPDCFLYMDFDSGGLGLANPVPEFAQYVDISENRSLLERGEEGHELPPLARALMNTMRGFSSQYRADKKRSTERLRGKKKSKKHGPQGSDTEYELSTCDDELGRRLRSTTEFMSFSDYVATSEEHSRSLRRLYESLLGAPAVRQKRRKTKDWASDLFSDELVRLFGGRMAEDEFLTLGLYRTLVEEKVRWEG
jgi:Sec-independent protein translocase protein TatA